MSMRALLMLAVMGGVEALLLGPMARSGPGLAAGGRAGCLRMEMSEAVAKERIQAMVEGNKIFLFMKGSKLFPQCGFSNTAVQILNTCGIEYETFDVLSDNAIREGVKQYSNWPTIPQCYIEGEFVGGCDLLIEMYQSGELQEMVERAAAS